MGEPRGKWEDEFDFSLETFRFFFPSSMVNLLQTPLLYTRYNVVTPSLLGCFIRQKNGTYDL